jgi:hypothetical protein
MGVWIIAAKSAMTQLGGFAVMSSTRIREILGSILGWNISRLEDFLVVFFIPSRTVLRLGHDNFLSILSKSSFTYDPSTRACMVWLVKSTLKAHKYTKSMHKM